MEQQQAQAELARLLSALDRKKATHKLSHYEPYGFQMAFHNAVGYMTSIPASQRALMAGNKCLTPWTTIQTGRGERRVCELLGETFFDVHSWDGDFRCERQASAIFLKSIEPAFRFHLDNGEVFECSYRHRVLSSVGWIEASRLILLLDGQHSTGRGEDYPASYVADDRPHDLQLHYPEDSGLDGLPSPAGAPIPCRNGCTSDAMGTKSLCTHVYQGRVRLPIFADDPDLLSALFENFLDYCGKSSFRHDFQNILKGPRIEDALNLHREGSGGGAGRAVFSSFQPLIMVGGNKILSYEEIGFQPIVDFEVAGTHCYEAAGVIHHNTGKTYSGGMETAMHLTGLYPDWFKGRRFYHATNVLVGGYTNESVRDLCQAEIFGDPTDDRKLGTGTVPIEKIGKVTRKAGVPNALDIVQVKHVSGAWSKCMMRAYEQGAKKHMGSRIHVGWLDEEPPEDIWAQYIRGTFSTKGILYITFTPEEGVTKVVHGFINELQKGQALIRATWDDAPHMNHEFREQMLAATPAYQREMRSKGIPLMGSGLVFQVPEEQISYEGVKLNEWWPRICAIDFGIDHAFAAVWVAWDRDTDTLYVYDCYKVSGEKMPVHVSKIKTNGEYIPVIWPHDGLQRQKDSGEPLAELYRKEGANMYHEQFSNPPAPGVEEGKGGNSIEYGIEEILHRMQTNRFKIDKGLKLLWDELRMYHRVDGKIVALNDDAMSAMRYAALSIRHAQTPLFKVRAKPVALGASNW